MAIGDYQWLSWKNKATRERDAREYEEWAFPYGQAQRDKLTDLLKELYPAEDPSVALVCHLTAKELVSRYHEIYDMEEHHAFAVKSMAKDFKKYRRMFRKGNTRFVYAALGKADLEITADLNYPSPAEILAQAEIMEKEFNAALGD